jgi:DnaJ family protein A protein 2
METKTCYDILEFKIEPGMRSGRSFTFKNKGNPTPQGEYGDLCIVLKEKKHPIFMRSRNNLVHKVSIGLVESLCGFEYTLPFLDGTDLKMHYPGVIRPPGDAPFCLCYTGKGMPSEQGNNGDLILLFEILYPQQVSEEIRLVLEKFAEPLLPRALKKDREEWLKTSTLLEPKNIRQRDSFGGESESTHECVQS